MAGQAESSSSAWRWSAILFVAVFAFLLASYPARNTNLWGHLAAGRNLIRGETATGAIADMPVHRAWIYNVALYLIHLPLGDTGLVLVKALLVVGFALLLLGLSRVYGGWWLPATCTALALLACSTRLLLQPEIVSYLLFGLSLWFLRPRAEGEQSLLPPWPLLVVFVMWANTDAWFTVGLATVALLWLGQTLDSARGTTKGTRFSPTLRLFLSVSLLAAVCLLNPLHVRAFTPPAELSWLWGAGASSTAGRVTSPFQRDYFTTLGASPAGLAVFPLLAIGFLSFILNRRAWRWERFLPWLGLAVLSCFEVRAVPFFAILGGPVLAWNLRETLVRQHVDERWRDPDWRLGRLVWCGLVAALGVALLICAWPGWLQAPPFEPRRWAVELPPAPARGAEAAQRWHQQGDLSTGSRVLHLSPETVYAFAWYCPEVRGVLDHRLTAALRNGEPDWPDRMHAAGIDHVIVYDRDRGNLSAILTRLLADAEQWPLLFLEGDVAVFGWRDPATQGAEDPFRTRRLDLDRLAFRPNGEARAPDSALDESPVGRRWQDAFWKRAPSSSTDRGEATLCALCAESMRRTAPERKLTIWEASQAAALVGAAGGWSPIGSLTDAQLRLILFRPRLPQEEARARRLPPLDRLAHALRERFWQRQDDTSPALLYLTVRAARRALAVNPDDAQTQLVLGEAYVRLLHATRERAWAERMPELGQLRLAQASAALNRAVALRPDLAQAHLSLGGLYRDLGYQDLALDHLRTYFTLALKSGPPPGVDASVFRQDAAQFEESLEQLTRQVADSKEVYASEAVGKLVPMRATLAREKGLAGLARDILLESDIAQFGFGGLVLELELLLGTGRARDVRDWTDPQHKSGLGPAYHWLRAQSMAALGAYTEAREECDDLAVTIGPSGGLTDSKNRELIATLVAKSVLDAQPTWGGLPLFLRQVSSLAGLTPVFRRQADVWTLRGLLALEQGEVAEAEDSFRQALVLWKGGVDFNGRPIAQDCLDWLSSEGSRQ